MKEKNKTKAIDVSLAAQVSDKVEIVNVLLKQSSCYRKPEAGKTKIGLEIKCDIKHEVDKKNSIIIVFPDFRLKGYHEKQQKEEPILNIEAVFVLIYRISSFTDLGKEHFEAFANTNGIYNAWPYWREYVQNTIARMGLPPLTIPVFRIVKPAEKPIKKTTKSKKQTS